MGEYTLTIVDTSGIQEYIFGANNLKQNAGASYLVEQATRGWALTALAGLNHNVTDLDNPETPFRQVTIECESDHLDAEVIYAGGGNIVVLFRQHPLAVEFAKRLTQIVLLDAPGLRINLVHQDFDWKTQALGGESGIVSCTMQALQRRKGEQSFMQAALGLSVNAACAFTGLPAVGVGEDNTLLSAEAAAKRQSADLAHKRLCKLIQFQNYTPARDFDDMGRSEGESSYIAVVHADGNGIGKRIAAISKFYATAAQNRDYIEKMRNFSQSMRRVALFALQKTVDHLIESVKFTEDEPNGIIDQQIRIATRKGERLLPFRPVVFGGDDITFVCDGRLGLSLTAYYLQQFSIQCLDDGELAHCRAGVAVVKTHYPFARAYDLAEKLCDSAKSYIKESRFNEKGLTAMDWHFGVGGMVLELQEIRKREYMASTGSLLMRPISFLSVNQHEWRTWDIFHQIVTAFKHGSDWQDRRNKVKALHEVLRSGPDLVRHFRNMDTLPELPPVASQPDMQIQGWQGKHCAYFDAIEVMDHFAALDASVAEKEKA